MRWDRLARALMLGVLAVLLYLYVSAGTSILGAWHSAAQRRSQLTTMQSDNRHLRAQRDSLQQTNTVIAEARRLGMVRPGEQSYIVPGLPSR